MRFLNRTEIFQLAYLLGICGFRCADSLKRHKLFSVTDFSLKPIIIETMNYLAWPDYLILVAFLVISLGIGVYHSLTGGRQRTTSEFIIANRSLKVLPTALSLAASYQSATTILGSTAEMYSYGSQFMVMILFSTTLGIVLTMQVAVPWMYPLKFVSINEVILHVFVQFSRFTY